MGKPVAVLGSGPAGLMAAWACMLSGTSVVVLSDGGKSRLGGAQFLHAPIPGMHQARSPETVVKYVRRGDPEVYKRKAFGSLRVPWRPWTDGGQPEEREAWSLSLAYDSMWEVFGESVETNKQHIDLKGVVEVKDKFAFVVSTIPLNVMCVNESHKFVTQNVRIHPDAFEELPDNTVLYDGTKDKSWYRVSNIFGTTYTEWGEESKAPPIRPMRWDSKPMYSDCDCLNRVNGILTVGRRGRFDAAQFSHDAFFDTMTAIGMRYGR